MQIGKEGAEKQRGTSQCVTTALQNIQDRVGGGRLLETEKPVQYLGVSHSCPQSLMLWSDLFFQTPL